MMSEDVIDAVAAALRDLDGAPDDSLAGVLARRWPGHHFTVCSDDDIVAARPVRCGAGFNLYLVAGTGGCVGLTDDPGHATGFVVAATEGQEA